MAQVSPSPDQVRAALDELLNWSELGRSPQLSRFLKHIVEAKLRGEEANIKAYSIAVDVLGRPPTFDPQLDPIVRVQARRLRGLLQEFYRQNLSHAGARITLPVGRYVPDFEIQSERISDVSEQAVPEPLSPPLVEDAESRPRAPLGRLQSLWAQALAAITLVLLLGLLLYGLQAFRSGPAPVPVALPFAPKIYLSAYETPPGQLEVFSQRLADQMGALLARSEDVDLSFDDGETPIDRRQGVRMLSGSIVPSFAYVRIDSMLTDAVTGEVIWGQSVSVPRPGADDAIVAATAARKIVRALVPARGPLHASGLQWIEAAAMPLPGISDYTCRLAYMSARELTHENGLAKARDCYERLLVQKPEEPAALAAKAWIDGRDAIERQRPGDRVETLLDAAARLADRALRLNPGSSFVHQQMGNIETWRGNLEAAQRSFSIALGFDPLNTDARAGYAITLARLEQWADASRQAQFALADTTMPSAWYYTLPTLLSLRAGNLAEAVEFGRIAAPASELALIAALSAAGMAGDQAARTELLPRLMQSEALQLWGVLPWLRQNLPKDQAVEQMAAGLRAAGVPEEALTGPFVPTSR